MRIILREDVPDLGIIGEIVNVKAGYARNYLFARGLAVVADERSLKKLEHEKRVISAKRLKERGSIDAMVEALSTQTIEIEMRAGRGGRLFGSVTNNDVKQLLDEKGFDIDRRRIDLKTPIKMIGEHEVVIRVGHDVTTTISVNVVPEGGELVDEAVEAGAASDSAAEPTATSDVVEGAAEEQDDPDAGDADAGDTDAVDR